MKQITPDFQIFIKPVGSLCNLNCSYCYYLDKADLYPDSKHACMPDDILEKYISQHIRTAESQVIMFSWHGGEPALAGIDFFRKALRIQNKYKSDGQQIINGIQTNGTLLNEEFCRFLAEKKFFVGISIDGPEYLHSKYRKTRGGDTSFVQTMNGYRLLQRYGVPCEILCVIHSENVKYPLEIYHFLKELHAGYITFLPLVIRDNGAREGVNKESVTPPEFGRFLCAIFDEWKENDIGKIKVQIFEEALRTAFHQGHTLCIFKKICGGVLVLGKNGDLYSCDHFVDKEHLLGNLSDIELAEMLASCYQQEFGRKKLASLPLYCLECEVREMCNGECPKNRFILAPDGEYGLNYLCQGYKLFFNHCKPFVEEVARVWKEMGK